MRRAFFGGSFDPIHFGHLLLAEAARESCALDQLIFVPAGIPPHKRLQKKTCGEDRFQMIQRAIAPYPEFNVTRFEIDSAEISFTVQTLRHFKKIYPNDDLFWIVGSEMFSDIPNWFCPQEICQLASLITTQRSGFPEPDFSLFRSFVSDEVLEKWKSLLVTMPPVGISSTLIRSRIQNKASVRFMTPDAVIEYIKEKHLY